jgi:hypothetical protein
VSRLVRHLVLKMTSGAAGQGHGGMIYSAINAAAAGAQVRDTCLQMRTAAHQQR